MQESNAGRSPYLGRGLGWQEIAGEGNDKGGGQHDGKFHDRYLQQAAGLAFLAGFAGLARIGKAVHIVTTVLPHLSHTRSFHRASVCLQLNARHPAEGKRQTEQENEVKPQVAFHARSLVASNEAHNYRYTK